MEKDLASTLKYFSFFDYSPSFEEIYTFYPSKTSKNALKTAILKIEPNSKHKAVKSRLKYTIGEYGIKQSQNSNPKTQISKQKINNWRFRLYLKLVSLFPQVKLIGLSGSISMMNAKLDDDIDLFIISAKNRLYTARFLATIFAYIMGLKRGLGQIKAPNKVCLNLFFDEANLSIPDRKKTLFVGHEVLQMKPLIYKNGVYEHFLAANSWVFKLFPNAKSQILNHKSQTIHKHFKFKNLNLFGIRNLKFIIFTKIESVLKDLQLSLINRHKTTEIVTNTQLWFHPDDFEKKINDKISTFNK